MLVSELSAALKNNPTATIRFRLPDGLLAAAHAHVTEVARISKTFIDCGGTFREEHTCRLQTWVADDIDHRLTAQKLGRILEKAGELLGKEPLSVEVEHDVGFVTQFSLRSIEHSGEELVLTLEGKHTACLAPELCCPPQLQGGVLSIGRKK